MSSIKKPNKINKKQIKQFVLGFGGSVAVLLIILFFVNLLSNNTALSLSEAKKGRQFLEKNDYVNAESSFRNAVKADSKNADAREGLLTVLDILNKNDEMLTTAVKGTEMFHGNNAFYKFTIKGYVKQGKTEDAVKFIKSITIQPVLLNLKDERPTPLKASPNPGSYDRFITVTLSSDEKSVIYYTTDGTFPTQNSKKYSAPITVDKEKLNIRAIAINDQNLISDDININYAIYNDNQKYTFADPKIEQIVRSQLSKTSGDVLYRDIVKITRLSNYDITGKPVDGYIRKLDDLLAMKSLTEISFNNEPVVTGFSVFASLSSLKSINLTACGIDSTDLKDICSAKWLNVIKLDKNQIDDLTQLAQIENLRSFSCSDNKITNLEPFGVLTSINDLNLSKNNIANADILNKLTALRSLDISNNLLTTINPFLSLINIRELKLSTNQITDISGISVLNNLNNLDLSANKLTNISPLSQLSNLKMLDLSYNFISDLAPLSSCNLTDLTLINCGINDLAAISSISTLKNLNVKNTTTSTSISPYVNDITDLTPVSRLQSLELLNVSANINLASLRSLLNCRSLRSLYCLDCPNITVSELSNSFINVYNK